MCKINMFHIHIITMRSYTILTSILWQASASDFFLCRCVNLLGVFLFFVLFFSFQFYFYFIIISSFFFFNTEVTFAINRLINTCNWLYRVNYCHCYFFFFKFALKDKKKYILFLSIVREKKILTKAYDFIFLSFSVDTLWNVF